jgi:hypothetical protein
MLYFYDRVAQQQRGVLDGAGTWWFGSSPTNFGLKVLAPASTATGMTIYPDGDVALGPPGATDNDNTRFTVNGSKAFGEAIRATQSGSISASGERWDTAMMLEARHYIPTASVMNTGGVIGAQIKARNMGPGSVYYTTGGYFVGGNAENTLGTVASAIGIQAAVFKGAGTVHTGYGVYIQDTEATVGYGVYQVGANDSNVFRGRIVIGEPIVAPAFVPDPANALNVNGNAHFSGTVTGTNIKAHYQDVAEWVPAASDLLPGTVVVLDPRTNNTVVASATAYDVTIAGVVSHEPGVILGEAAANKEQIATTGRVRVRVDASHAPIRIGDILVTSDVPGTAMRSTPIQVGAFAMHRPGTILGKALEPLSSGTGEILVLLSMQ